jgi:hypothetical protein
VYHHGTAAVQKIVSWPWVIHRRVTETRGTPGWAPEFRQTQNSLHPSLARTLRRWHPRAARCRVSRDRRLAQSPCRRWAPRGRTPRGASPHLVRGQGAAGGCNLLEGGAGSCWCTQPARAVQRACFGGAGERCAGTRRSAGARADSPHRLALPADCELCASHPSLQAGTSTGARQTGIGIPSR